MKCNGCLTPDLTDDDWPVEFMVGMIPMVFCRTCWNGIVEGVQINYEWEDGGGNDFDIEEHPFITKLKEFGLNEKSMVKGDAESLVKHYDLLRDTANRKVHEGEKK